MSEKYRLMIYFAIATMHFYRDDLVVLGNDATVKDSVLANKKVIDRINEEALNFFEYELSYEQIYRAISAYLSASQLVDETKAATK